MAIPMVGVELLGVNVGTFDTLHMILLNYLYRYQVWATTQSYKPVPSFSLLLEAPHVTLAIFSTPLFDQMGVLPLMIPKVYSHHVHLTHFFFLHKV